jgi:coproporphyrinogen III oxidase-like Fe-S oxidoreductase
MNFINHIAAKACEHYLKLHPTTTTLPTPKQNKKYLLYVHIPFCHTLCTYCTFHRFLFDERRTRTYFEALRAEIRLVHAMGYEFDSMYIGGGTTTVLLGELVRTIELAKELFGLGEVSCEAYPNNLTNEFASTLCGLVDRYSVGVQSFDDGILKQMGRYEKFGSGADTAKRAQDVIGKFAILNVDMIFNFPTQDIDMLHRDIDTLLSIMPDQISYYPLMSSPSAKGIIKRSMGEVSLTNEKQFYYEILDSLSGKYDMLSSWAFGKKEKNMYDEYVVDHDEYVGVGSGAFSFLSGSLYANSFSLARYESAVNSGKLALERTRYYPKRAQMWYRMMVEFFGGSLDMALFNSKFGIDIAFFMAVEISFLKLRGYIKQEGSHLLTTHKGRYVFVSLMKEFYIGMDYIRESSRALLKKEDGI